MKLFEPKLPPMPPVRPHKEAVNHPSHYCMGNIEVIDAIDAWQLGFSLGNAVKYIARAGRKDPTKYVEDLKKAMFYIQHEIDRKTKGLRV